MPWARVTLTKGKERMRGKGKVRQVRGARSKEGVWWSIGCRRSGFRMRRRRGVCGVGRGSGGEGGDIIVGSVDGVCVRPVLGR
jgi:hypothetical protein